MATLLYLSKRLSHDPDVAFGQESAGAQALDEAFLSRIGMTDGLPRFRDLARRLAV